MRGVAAHDPIGLQPVEDSVAGFVRNDVDFIRLTRTGEPNLFLYKHDIKYLYEAS